ncbi:hypothetical protein NESM_000409700 [Novymonas esmeraldas]|uniref:Uncharacterized protein n=1 Tax=Novymonas esmeraldas TaxID=1808958 RepID=A0AAW0ENE0_9TRYP
MRRTLTAALVAAAALFMCLAPALSHGYSTTYTARNLGSSVMAFDPLATDQCKLQDIASHTAMSTSASIQQALKDAYDRSALTGNIPLGGMTEQAVCTAQQCRWTWYRGLFRTTRPQFLQGVFFWGLTDTSTPVDKTVAVANAYTNFDRNYPRSWGNLSYWGRRLVVMQPSGTWVNVEMASKFSSFLCEYYVYAASDGVNRMVPTFPGGDPIPIVSAASHQYSYCGQLIRTDSQGRWVLPQCNKPFPWWAALIIAVICYIILVAAIIIVWCCCCIRRRNEEEQRRRKIIGSQHDNEGAIPTQSELGLSRNSFTNGSSFATGTETDTDADTDDFSRRE